MDQQSDQNESTTNSPAESQIKHSAPTLDSTQLAAAQKQLAKDKAELVLERQKLRMEKRDIENLRQSLSLRKAPAKKTLAPVTPASKMNQDKLSRLPADVQKPEQSLRNFQLRVVQAALQPINTFQFLLLPAELRNQIYRLVILPKSGKTRRAKNNIQTKNCLSNTRVKNNTRALIPTQESRRTVPCILLTCRQIFQEAIFILRTETVLELEFTKSREKLAFVIEPRDRIPLITFMKLHLTINWQDHWVDYKSILKLDIETGESFQTPASLLLYIITRIGMANGPPEAPYVSVHVDFVIKDRTCPTSWNRKLQYRVQDAIFEAKEITSAFRYAIKFTSNSDELYGILQRPPPMGWGPYIGA